MEEIRQGIGLRAIGQTDPLVAYKREGHEMFANLLAAIQKDIVNTIYHVVPLAQPAAAPIPGNGQAGEAPLVRQPMAPRQTFTNRDPAPAGGNGRGSRPRGARPAAMAGKIGRNDLCPCGSGKKYKRCHGR
jgi:preprotein translocase subunit SecA